MKLYHYSILCTLGMVATCCVTTLALVKQRTTFTTLPAVRTQTLVRRTPIFKAIISKVIRNKGTPRTPTRPAATPKPQSQTKARAKEMAFDIASTAATSYVSTKAMAMASKSDVPNQVPY